MVFASNFNQKGAFFFFPKYEWIRLFLGERTSVLRRDEWNLHREAKSADSGGRSEIWCRENKIPQPYAAHRSAVGLFPLTTVQINYDHHVSSPAPINHTDY